ncbi:hypothetical protein B0H12DRAFT_440482 [Mycena haematopus]|nr:hypothetical protein B0H12DRAFT_440482 [Mycena haematopus]
MPPRRSTRLAAVMAKLSIMSSEQAPSKPATTSRKAAANPSVSSKEQAPMTATTMTKAADNPSVSSQEQAPMANKPATTTTKATANPSESSKEQAPVASKPATAPEVSKPVENSVHCVQCHESYKPSQNRASSCQIDHYHNGQEDTHENGGYRHTLPCCGLSIWDDNDDGPHKEWKPKMCFVGLHTTEHKYDRKGKRIVYTGAEYCSDCDTDDEEDVEDSDAEGDGA